MLCVYILSVLNMLVREKGDMNAKSESVIYLFSKVN